jgi:uncharacterized membrane protein YebE (DUF533 family)
MKIQTLIAAVLLCTAGVTFAQAPAPAAAPATPRVDQRQAVQQQRIEQGVAHGQVTPREAAGLQREQNHIAAKEARAKSDGVVTRHERQQLHQAQNRAGRHIQQKKHHRVHRPVRHHHRAHRAPV